MRNKMITLCPTTYETAKAMPNFSAWVRTKLREIDAYHIEDPLIHQYQCPICTTKHETTTRHARNCDMCKYSMKYLGVVE